jgi:hypothetical protein
MSKLVPSRGNVSCFYHISFVSTLCTLLTDDHNYLWIFLDAVSLESLEPFVGKKLSETGNELFRDASFGAS